MKACLCGKASWMKHCTVHVKLLMEFSSAVLWFSMSCAISVLRNKERKFAISKAQCLHAMCVCLNLYLHDHIRCIVKVCVSQLFLCREVTHNTDAAALYCEAIFASQYFIMSQQVTRLSFTRYNQANFLCFSLFMGWYKSLVITEISLYPSPL